MNTASAPSITSLSASTLARSGRLVIHGIGFGRRDSGTVRIGGATAPVTRWSDTSITAYVPEAAPLGPVRVHVAAETGSSNAMPLVVTLRPDGQLAWRFQADALYILQRPAVGPDGTIVAHDSSGFVYALQPDGGLKWIFQTPAFAYGPPSVGPDGTVYVASINTVYALGPGGTLKWRFTDATSQGVMAGPTVGPDGNVYVAMDAAGRGVVALSPTGQLLWNNPGTPSISEYGGIGAEIVFGPSTAGAPADQLYVAFDRQTDPRLWAFDLTGVQRWVVATGGQTDPFMQFQAQPAVGPDGTVYMTSLAGDTGWGLFAYHPRRGALAWTLFPDPANGMSAPDVGPDGVIYLARSLAYLQAVDPSGTARWQVSDGTIVDYPVVSPTNAIVFAGGRPDFGLPGFVRAYRVSGRLLWQIDLGQENGGSQIMYSRPRFAPDGSTVYFGTTILGGDPDDPYCYLYAVDTSRRPRERLAPD
ncbi:MAG: hypothetical protein A3F92_01435 [Candidatus Rokubacteria bacterium RIFCSPLOWO2_12_FULL_71_22]|nr:MAG: hypothetical protein A3F92_01435 [Candidatus Rokubacteria bacterium RIFCSPLOWO2_12_FULL_71_22]